MLTIPTHSPLTDQGESLLTTWVARIRDQAREQVAQTSASAMIAQLRHVHGERLMTLILGSGEGETNGDANDDQRGAKGREDRLRAAFEATVLIELADSSQTARAWLVGMNPNLNDRPPVLMLADDPDGGEQVLRAACSVLARG